MSSDNFIKFRSAADENTYDCGNGCSMDIYRNANLNEYNAYVDRLISDGFAVMQRNINNNNYYTALKKDVFINAYFTRCDNTVRITAERDCSLGLEPTACKGDGETVFYGFESDQTLIDCGMCLMVQCPDHSFFVVDSGHYFQTNDNDRIYKFMRERTPEGQKIVVNGWLITHTHTDHVSKLMDFLKYNCDDVVIEGFYANLLSSDYTVERHGKEEKVTDTRFRQMLKNLTDIPKHKLHSGQRFYIRNLTFDVLCTHEDVYPERIEDFNDSSLVVMLTAEGTRIFIPGDASGKEDRVLAERYGASLECDIVQVSHHGHFGLSKEVYEYLNGNVAVFPVTRIKFDEEYPRYEANRRAVELADEYYITSDGTVKITLPYREGSAVQLPDETFEDFEKIRHLWGYEYTEEYRCKLYELFLKNGGNLESAILPIDYNGTFLD